MIYILSWTTKKHQIVLSRPPHSKLKKIQGLFKDLHRNLRTFQGLPLKFKDLSRLCEPCWHPGKELARRFGPWPYWWPISLVNLIIFDDWCRGYYMAAQGYEISLRVLKNISRVSAANKWNIFQHEKRTFVSPSGHCNILFII